MRDIKFRGKRIDNGEWVHGSLLSFTEGREFIGVSGARLDLFEHDFEHVESVRAVDPATVGQYTGLKDKNGVWIYEGDYLRAGEKYKSWSGKDFGHLLLVEWRGTGFAHKVIDQYGDAQPTDYFAPSVWSKQSEVIGNVHDNPELAKEA
jgi:phage uncharacterized protein TIGR01671